jgi:hypothetical protein
MICAMAGLVEIGTNARCRLRIDRQRIAPAALAGEAQRIETAVLMQGRKAHPCENVR